MANRKQVIVEVIIEDNNGAKMSLTFFNQAWREREMRIGRQGLFAGKIGTFKNIKQLAHPELEWLPGDSDVEDAIGAFADKYLPIYPATGKFASWKIAKALEIVLDSLDKVDDFLPEEIRNQFSFPNLHEAYKEVHRPTSIEQAESARKRLTFDEAFLLQLTLLKQKQELSNIHTIARIPKTPGVLSEFDKQLPFQLTPGQLNVSSEIFQDLIAEHPMHRLLQGEVGSGKTIVALRAALSVIDANAQVALLAPTEVLAQQHFRTITKQLGELATKGKLGAPDNAIAIALLTGSLSASEKKEIHAKIQSGEIDVVLIHDGARPLASPDLYKKIAEMAVEKGGAIPTTSINPVEIDLNHDNQIVRVQTPQGFRAKELLTAYEKAEVDGFIGTDTGACVETYFPEIKAFAVEAEVSNLKITFAQDLKLAEALLKL